MKNLFITLKSSRLSSQVFATAFSLSIFLSAIALGDTLGPCGIAISESVPASIRSILKSDLERISTLEGSPGETQLHKEIFGSSLSTKPYCSFLKNGMARISFGTCENGGVSYKPIACESGSNGTVVLTEGYLNPKIDFIQRAAYLFHEARHRNPLYGWHSACPETMTNSLGVQVPNPYAGQRECDESSIGAHGVAITWLRNLQKYGSDATSDAEKVTLGYLADRYQMKYISTLKARVELNNDIETDVP